MDFNKYKSSIKAKIIIAFGSAIIILVVAGIISYRSVNDLMKSLNFLSKPDVKIVKLNDLISDLSLSENSIRSYFISNDKEYYNSYNFYSDRLRTDIDTLSKLTNDTKENADKIKKVLVLWNEKDLHTQELVKLYKKKEDQKIPDGILSKLNKDNPDLPALIITKTITIKNIAVPVKVNPDTINNEENHEKRPLLSRIFKRKEKEAVEDSVYKYISQREISSITDTIYTRGSANEIREEKFTRMLANIRRHNNQTRKELKENEADIIQKEISLIKYIQDIVLSIKDSEQKNTEQRIVDAKNIVEISIMKIFIFGVSGIGAILLFGLLLMDDVAKNNLHKSHLVNEKNQIKEMIKAKEIFLATMSHEIRTPLNSIIGFTEQLTLTDLNSKQKFYLQAVSHSATHLQALVNDILDHSRIEAGKIDFESIEFNLNSIVKEVYDVFQLEAKEKGLGIEYKFQEEGEYNLIGDPLRLKQVLFNLVSNAIKFTERGYITIITEVKFLDSVHTRVCLSVADSGIGIPHNKISNIFDSFTQADSSISRKYGGTGLGLAISKRLIELQGGAIKVSSRVNVGSVFYVEIPYKLYKKEYSNFSHSNNFDLSSFIGLKILVVEDDEFNLLLFHTVLNKWKCEVTMVSNGNEAIELINKDFFDLIITDVHMPDMSGVELLKLIRSSNESYIAEMPILAVTADVIKESVFGYMESGFSGVLLKPFKEDSLAMSIWNILNRSFKMFNDVSQKNYKRAESMLSDFILFGGDNEEMTLKLIDAFLENSKSLLKDLHAAFQNEQWVKLKDIIHKLIPGFGHLHNAEMVSLLQDLEFYLEECSNPDTILLDSKLKKVIELSKSQFKLLEEEKKKLS